jgi:hypothetical protein
VCVAEVYAEIDIMYIKLYIMSIFPSFLWGKTQVMLTRPASRKTAMPRSARIRHSASCLAVLFALLVRVAYVPYHLAIDEHEGSHAHGSAAAHEMALEALNSCESHPAETLGHEHAEDAGHPPHAADDHDTELMQARSSLSSVPVVQVAVLETETWRLVLSGVHGTRSLRVPPLRAADSCGVLIARGPPATA